MDRMVARLDRLYAQLKNGKPCQICHRPSTEVHHIIGRTNLLLRYDIKNLIPLCSKCHRLVHDKKENIFLYLSWYRADYLLTLKNVELHDYLLSHNLTREQFYMQKEKELREEICKA